MHVAVILKYFLLVQQTFCQSDASGVCSNYDLFVMRKGGSCDTVLERHSEED